MNMREVHSVLKNPQVLIILTPQCTRNKIFIAFINCPVDLSELSFWKLVDESY